MVLRQASSLHCDIPMTNVSFLLPEHEKDKIMIIRNIKNVILRIDRSVCFFVDKQSYILFFQEKRHSLFLGMALATFNFINLTTLFLSLNGSCLLK